MPIDERRKPIRGAWRRLDRQGWRECRFCMEQKSALPPTSSLGIPHILCAFSVKGSHKDSTLQFLQGGHCFEVCEMTQTVLNDLKVCEMPYRMVLSRADKLQC